MLGRGRESHAALPPNAAQATTWRLWTHATRGDVLLHTIYLEPPQASKCNKSKIADPVEEFNRLHDDVPVGEPLHRLV